MCAADPLASVRAALDRAIAEVAEAEYGRLAHGVPPDAQATQVDAALKSLRRLQQGTPPDYDSDWVVLFYLTWYQPRQVHLAYAALRQYVSANNPPQCVVDYGCGAWAVQLALAIALTEEDCAGAAVHGLDPSVPMRRLGQKLWSKFNDILGKHFPNDDFAQSLAINLEFIAESSRTHICLADAASHLPVPTADCWFTAVHAIYQTNEADLQDVLRPAEDDNAPAFAVATFDEYSQRTSFFRKLGFESATLAATWVGDCPATTRWRHRLVSLLPDFGCKYLLNSPVTWDPGQRLANGQDVAMTRRNTQ